MPSSHGHSWILPFLNELDKSDNDDLAHSRNHRALLILNQPFSLQLLLRLWHSTSYHCCADGGANRLFDIFELGHPTESKPPRLEQGVFLPDFIKGDLDSIRPDVRKYYESREVPILYDPDQYSTDLMKCLSAIREQTGINEVVLLGGLSGRLDQTIHVLSYLQKIRNDHLKVFAVTDDNAGWVLTEGTHTIRINKDILGPTCGLLPVGVESTVLTTEGLKWNLYNQESSFSGLISTSNAIVKDVITVSTTRPIWWCIELNPSHWAKKDATKQKEKS